MISGILKHMAQLDFLVMKLVGEEITIVEEEVVDMVVEMTKIETVLITEVEVVTVILALAVVNTAAETN